MIAESTLHSKVVHNKEIKGDGKVGRKKKNESDPASGFTFKLHTIDNNGHY